MAKVQDEGGLEGDYVMMFEKEVHYAVIRKLKEVWTPGEFVVQYEGFLNKGLDCGGAYGLAEESPSLEDVDNESPYIIMFGPDKW